MIKIWGKILINEKIIKHKSVEINPKTTSFFEMLKTVSEQLGISTPVLLDKHVYDFNVFGFCVFKPDDFVENVIFDKFVLERIKE